jgi:hypothetical protein
MIGRFLKAEFTDRQYLHFDYFKLKTMKKRHRNDYKNINDPLPEKLEEGVRKVIYSRVIIDRSVFQKKPSEKLRLKQAKADFKNGITREHKKLSGAGIKKRRKLDRAIK